MLLSLTDKRDGPLVVLFGSQHDITRERKVWEWRRSTEGMNRIFFCDTNGLWYQEHIDEIVDRLSKLSPRALIGCSRGGYAALLIAHLIGSSAIAYSPQTILEDSRWPDIEKARAISKYPDLSFITGNHHIYYCKHKRSDAFHAERMKVHLHPVECDTHNAARFVKVFDPSESLEAV